MNILLVNDDGYFAEGIACLFKKLSYNHNVYIVGPDRERSACGHAITLTSPLRLKKISDKVYSCDGTPVDCVRIGIKAIDGFYPDLIVSGINKGANLAQDTFYSGTVAAAREGILNEIPSLAVSLVCDFDYAIDKGNYFDEASSFMCRFIRKIEDSIKNLDMINELININIPNISQNEIRGVKLTELGKVEYDGLVMSRKDFRERDYYWIGGGGRKLSSINNSDTKAILEKYISISVLNILPNSSDKIAGWTNIIANI